MRLKLFVAAVSHFFVMTTCLLEEGKHITLNFDSENEEVSFEDVDVKVKTRAFRAAHRRRKLSVWGNFMTFVHCHSSGEQHDHCPSHHHRHHKTNGGSHSNEGASGCNEENCQTGCNGGQCYDDDDDDIACDGENCENGYYSQPEHPTPSPSTEISNDMCWYCVGNNSSGLQSNNMNGMVYGGIAFAGVGIIASLVLRKRKKQITEDHLLSGAVNKRMKTVSGRFKNPDYTSGMQKSLSFEDPRWALEMVTDYYKA